MPLEATMIVLDNSEWMRNGDYTPTRLEAQRDAVNLIFSSKTQSNPENTVGLMTMAGKGPEVLVTLTSDMGKILSATYNIKVGGKANLTTGIQVAQLALKHRQNKNQRQRIIVFVGSPINADEKALSKLAKKTKKNNVAVDIINFGEEAENTSKLEAFIQAINSSDNSHLVTIPPGPYILSERLISSPIISGEDGIPAGFTSGAGSGFEFGVDPNLDPELALALRISLEEEKARQEAEAAKAATANAPETESTSMAVDSNEQEHGTVSAGQDHTGDIEMEMTEEEQIARAIELSKETSSGQQQQQSNDYINVMQDPQFMNSVLGGLPGVNPADPMIQNALAGVSLKDYKTVKVALTKFYGIGMNVSARICAKLSIHDTCKMQELTENQLNQLSAVLSDMTLGADLKRQVKSHIMHHRHIGSYKGKRHAMSYPVRGQRTQTNAKTAKRLNARFINQK
ncbi:267_t:CDS:10 [Ambispora leptoticha]|uniref:26S proteasome regulatory subunit RPN10 n=1 Tax=Ambispora leptoticha TaxID=144679 RepID=A0A9N8W3F7_9GLOM|nr:267_t:CDS:10 [Ambispora leptoticha]